MAVHTPESPWNPSLCMGLLEARGCHPMTEGDRGGGTAAGGPVWRLIPWPLGRSRAPSTARCPPTAAQSCIRAPSPWSAIASQREAKTQQEAPERGLDSLSWLQLPGLCLAAKAPLSPTSPSPGAPPATPWAESHVSQHQVPEPAWGPTAGRGCGWGEALKHPHIPQPRGEDHRPGGGGGEGASLGGSLSPTPTTLWGLAHAGALSLWPAWAWRGTGRGPGSQ